MKELKDYEYYRNDLGALYCGDCLDVLPLINKKINSVWIDPIYNVGKDYGICKDSLSNKDYYKFMKKVFKLLKEKTNNFTVYIPTKYKLWFWNLLGPEYKEIILSYSPAGAIRYGFSNQFSTLLTNIKPNKKIRNVWNNCQMRGLGYFFKENNYGHPGYTSEDITGRVIQYFSKENDVIMDSFFGTGTTGLRCEQLKRQWIGIEISEKYCAIAKQRIKNETNQFKLPLTDIDI